MLPDCMIKKILKNTTNEDIYIINSPIPANGELELSPDCWLDIAQNESVFTHINNGTLVVNDGTTDLSASLGLVHICKFQLHACPLA